MAIGCGQPLTQPPGFAGTCVRPARRTHPAEAWLLAPGPGRGGSSEGAPVARIGLLSDSHGRAETTRRAVAVLCEAGAERLIHLGDVGNIEVIDALLVSNAAAADPDATLPAHLVFGNVDWDHHDLGVYARHLGMHVEHPLGCVKADGVTVCFTHGDNPRLLDEALARQPKYLCHGHTHQKRDERVGPTRLINPGALFRAATYTVALLDTDHDRVTFLPVGDG